MLFIFPVARPQQSTEDVSDQRCGPQVNHRSLPAPLENKTSHNDVNNNRYVEASAPWTTEPLKPAPKKSEYEMNHESGEGNQEVHIFHFSRSALTSRRKRSSAGLLRLS